MIQIGGVCTTFCQEEGILLQKYAIEMGGVSRYFSKASGSGIDLTLLTTICPETITELVRCEFLRCKNYVTAPEINSPRGPHSPEITVRKSFKSPVRITVPKNNSKTISVM